MPVALDAGAAWLGTAVSLAGAVGAIVYGVVSGFSRARKKAMSEADKPTVPLPPMQPLIPTPIRGLAARVQQLEHDAREASLSRTIWQLEQRIEELEEAAADSTRLAYELSKERAARELAESQAAALRAELAQLRRELLSQRPPALPPPRLPKPRPR